jgi:hypothetical protein
VSSDDDPARNERRDLQEAKEAVGLFGVLIGQSAAMADQPEMILGPLLSALDSKLEKAATLLGEGSDFLEMIEHLRLVFSTAEEINFQLIQQNKLYIALVAQALKDRFNLDSGGGPGAYNFSIAEQPRVRWRTGHD